MVYLLWYNHCYTTLNEPYFDYHGSTTVQSWYNHGLFTMVKTYLFHVAVPWLKQMEMRRFCGPPCMSSSAPYSGVGFTQCVGKVGAQLCLCCELVFWNSAWNLCTSNLLPVIVVSSAALRININIKDKQ